MREQSPPWGVGGWARWSHRASGCRRTRAHRSASRAANRQPPHLAPNGVVHGELTMPADQPVAATRGGRSRRAAWVALAAIGVTLCLPPMAQAQISSRPSRPLSALSWNPAALPVAHANSERLHAAVPTRLVAAVVDSQPPRRFRRGAIGFLLGASTGVAVAYLVNRGNGEGRLENYLGIPFGLGIVGFVAGVATAR